MAAGAEYVSFLGVEPTADVMFSSSCKCRRGLVDPVEDLVWPPIAVASVCASPSGSGRYFRSDYGVAHFKQAILGFSTMTIVAGEQPSLLPLSAPCIPPITSDVVIDLSHWQAPVDFARAKSAGIVAVILKATQGSDWIDVTFAQRFAAATASGLLVGAYHFLDDSPPELQIENFLSVAEGCSVLALDTEPNAIGGTVTVAQATEAAGRLHMATGSLPLIYINRYGPDRRGTGLPNNVLSRCPLWLPAYNSRPVCPPGWSKWALWQHTDGNLGSDAVPVAGIGRCDRSRFAGTIADLVTWWENPQL